MTWSKFNKPNGVPVLLPAHILFFVSLIFGVAFFLPPSIFGVAQATLFQFSIDLGKNVPMIWGGLMLLATILHTVGTYFEKPSVSRLGAMIAFFLWGYAAIAYWIVGYFLGLLSIALPMMTFWGWYYLNIVKYSGGIKSQVIKHD